MITNNDLQRLERKWGVSLSAKGCCIAALLCRLVLPGTAQPPPAKRTAAKATVWTYTWTPGPGDIVPAADVCPLKYGKRWAYCVEIDDGPASTLAVSQPLLAQFTYTDAPPGVPGGAARPFVGGAAVFPLRLDTGNETFLSRQQLRELKSKGWAILNHSYSHSGNSWDPKAGLTPSQFRNELYWSQAILAAEAGDGRSPTHFVYPNGYREYTSYLKEFGFRSASRVAGKFPHLANPSVDLLDMDRSYLDESVWSKVSDPLAGIPATPAEGDVVIDFTHGMEAEPNSPNNKRWRTRLETIEARSGSKGDNSVWCAPTSEVVDYALAARSATLDVKRGQVTLTIPGEQSGTALTLHLVHVSPRAILARPPGGTLYRQGDQVWITSPNLGPAGAAPPQPGIEKVYDGPVQDFAPPKPIRIAGVRILQRGEPRSGFTLKIDLIAPGGSVTALADGAPGTNWGAWLLYPVLPNTPAILTQRIQTNTDPCLTKMEVWAVAAGAQ